MRRFPVRRALAMLAVAFVVNPAAATETGSFSRRNPVVSAVQKTRDRIVTIKVPSAGTRDTVGTGVIVDERGFVVTNRHVVGAARTLKVHLADGTA